MTHKKPGVRQTTKTSFLTHCVSDTTRNQDYLVLLVGIQPLQWYPIRMFVRATELSPTTAKLSSHLVEYWVNISVNQAYSSKAKNKSEYIKHIISSFSCVVWTRITPSESLVLSKSYPFLSELSLFCHLDPLCKITSSHWWFLSKPF